MKAEGSWPKAPLEALVQAGAPINLFNLRVLCAPLTNALVSSRCFSSFSFLRWMLIRPIYRGEEGEAFQYRTRLLCTGGAHTSRNPLASYAMRKNGPTLRTKPSESLVNFDIAGGDSSSSSSGVGVDVDEE